MDQEREYAHLDPLFEEYKYIARETVYKMFPRPRLTAKQYGIDLEDLFQYAYTGLWKACITYRADKGTKFKTHAINHVRWHLNERLKREGHRFKLEANKKYDKQDLPEFLHFDCPMEHGDGMEPTTLHELVDSGFRLEELAFDDLLIYDMFGGSISEKDAEILKMRVFQDLEYKDIGAKYGQTKENMGQRMKRLKDKMKRYVEVG